MSHIDDSLDLDNSVRKFIEKHKDKDDYCLYIRHNFLRGEGVVYTSNEYKEDDEDDLGVIPDLGDSIEAQFGDPEMFIRVEQDIINLTFSLCQRNPELKKLLINCLKNVR